MPPPGNDPFRIRIFRRAWARSGPPLLTLVFLGSVVATSARCAEDPSDDTATPFVDIETDTTTPLTLRVEAYVPGEQSVCVHLRALGVPFDDVTGSRAEACVSLGQSANGAYDYPLEFSQGTTASVVLFAQVFTNCAFDAGSPEGGATPAATQCAGAPGPSAVWPQAPTSIPSQDAGVDAGRADASAESGADSAGGMAGEDATGPVLDGDAAPDAAEDAPADANSANTDASGDGQ
jgi:hypothetical protein